MPTPRVVVVGDLLYDLLAKVDGDVTLGTDTFTRIRAVAGGSGANAAVWLASSGIETHFVGRVGDDVFGGFLREELERAAARGLDGGRVSLEFLTPTFVRFHGRVCVEAPPFAALVQNLLIRIPMLSAIHCGEVWQEAFKALVARAGEVETVADETTWVSSRRYSSFRRKGETLEGIAGRVEYAGPVEWFLSLLHIGQPTHAGKRAVFGLGRYRLQEA